MASQILFSDSFIASDGSTGISMLPSMTYSAAPYSNISSGDGLNGNFASGAMWLRLYKGTIPTRTELDAMTSLSAFRTADYILGFSTTCTKSNPNTTTIKFSWATSSFGTINAEGTATWFSLGSNDNNWKFPVLVGSVGSKGSGADLEVKKTNILSSDLWLCTELLYTPNRTLTLA